MRDSELLAIQMDGQLGKGWSLLASPCQLGHSFREYPTGGGCVRRGDSIDHMGYG